MSPANELLLIFGMILGICGVLVTIGLYRLCAALATIHFIRKEKQREINKTIQQLEDHANRK